MRTALILLLLLALAAVPGSVIPQSGVDALDADGQPRKPEEMTAAERTAFAEAMATRSLNQ